MELLLHCNIVVQQFKFYLCKFSYINAKGTLVDTYFQPRIFILNENSGLLIYALNYMVVISYISKSQFRTLTY